MTNHQLTGNEGEELAAGWLQRKGFVLLHRNWRYSYYEVDIIAHFNNVLHFIEVKTRRNKKFGEPEEAVDDKKIMRLMEAGEAFQYQYPQWKRVQYDVLSILLPPGSTPEYFFIEDVYL